MKKEDYYKTLGIDKNASTDEIRKAYRSMAKKYHPDKNKSHDAEDKFKEINEAYEVLSDPNKKAAYDRFGHASQEQGFGGGYGQRTAEFNQNGFESIFGGFGSIFEDLFGGGSTHRRTRGGKAQGTNKQAQITISFIESVLGVIKKVKLEKFILCSACNGLGAPSSEFVKPCSACNGIGEIKKRLGTPFGPIEQTKICSKCHGSGSIISKKCPSCKAHKYIRTVEGVSIKIPPGIRTGQSQVLKGFGFAGENGGKPGDLVLIFNVQEHKYFKRNNNDIHLVMPISVVDILLGNKITIPTPKNYILITVPKNTKSGEIITIKGKGIESGFLGSKGDLKIHVNIYIPEMSDSILKSISPYLTKIKDNQSEKFAKKVKDNK